MTSPTEPVQLLWTGGWDSSFRLMQLLLVDGRPVQPIYVIDIGRRTTLMELQAQAAIRADLLPRLPDPAMMAPTCIVNAHDYPPPAEHVALHEEMKKTMRVGSQYLWLTGPAQALGWSGVEMSVETHLSGRSDWQRHIFEEPGVLKSTPEAQMFRYWRFPVVNMTKDDMRDVAIEHGFFDVLRKRWFCFDPFGGRACGKCYPCSITIRDGAQAGTEFAPALAVRARQVARTALRRTREVRSPISR